MQWYGKRKVGRENDMSPQKDKCNEVRNGKKTLRRVVVALVKQSSKLHAKYMLPRGQQ